MNEYVRQRVLEVRKHGMIWLGAAMSLAEIETGLYCGGHPLAVIMGHVLGGILLYIAGLMGAQLRRNGMECTREAFGVWGMRCFAIANVLQLIGWTAVMIAQGANVAESVLPSMPDRGIVLLLGALIMAWIFVGLRSFSWIATIGMSLLLALTILLTAKIFMIPVPENPAPVTASFWEVFELSLAMPLSWLPLISDYTKDTDTPFTACASSAVVYTICSLWMYFLGMGLASLQAENLVQGVRVLDIGLIGVPVILISTVTTTYLDAYSAGESVKALLHNISSKVIAVIVCFLGMILAYAGIMERYTDFLYFISSLFAPMAVAMLTDHFLVRQHSAVKNFIAFLTGFMVYQWGLRQPNSVIGPGLAAIAATFVVEICLSGWRRNTFFAHRKV